MVSLTAKADFRYIVKESASFGQGAGALFAYVESDEKNQRGRRVYYDTPFKNKVWKKRTLCRKPAWLREKGVDKRDLKKSEKKGHFQKLSKKEGEEHGNKRGKAKANP